MAGLDLLCFDRLEVLVLDMNSTDAKKFIIFKRILKFDTNNVNVLGV